MREAGPTVQLCGDCGLAGKMEQIASMLWDRNAEEELASKSTDIMLLLPEP